MDNYAFLAAMMPAFSSLVMTPELSSMSVDEDTTLFTLCVREQLDLEVCKDTTILLEEQSTSGNARVQSYSKMTGSKITGGLASCLFTHSRPWCVVASQVEIKETYKS